MKKIFTIFIGIIFFGNLHAQITNTSFAAVFQLPLGSSPGPVQIEDMDGDGKKDIVVSGQIFRNIYSGGPFNTTSFAPGQTYIGGGGQLVMADMDGDGKKDIVGTGSVMRNLSTPGTLSFASPVSYVGGGSSTDIDVADIDGDGKLDVVFPSSGSQFSCYRNTSTPGSISFATRYDKFLSSIGFQGPYSIKCADFDLDGDQDVIIGCHDQGMCMLYNQSTPGFINFPSASYRSVPGTTDTGVPDFGIGDLNFDGYPDVYYDYQQRYTSPSGDYSEIMSNVFNASYGMITPVNTSLSGNNGPYSWGGYGVEIADLDLDGKLDLVENGYNAIRVWRNVYTGVGGNITFAGNFYPNTGYGFSFSLGGINNPGGEPNLEVATGDLTGDGFPEIVSANYNSNSIAIFHSLIDSTKNITAGPIANSLCIGGAVSIPYTVTGHFYGANNFTAQLSDATGSFATPVDIGTLTSTFVSGTINGTIPVGTPAGTGYRIRVISSTPVFIGADNGTDINITNSIPTSISIAVSPSNNICQGTSVTFTPTITGGGTPTYTWRVNGSIVSSGSTYTTSSLINGDNVTCTLTSSLSCASPNPILSNTITMNVTTSPLAQPSSMTGPTTACAFTSTTYSVPAVTGATSYTWTLPGGWTGTSTTNSITCTTGSTGGTVSCVAVNSCTTSVARTTSVTVTFAPTTSNAGPDQTICGTTTPLAANTPASGSGLWTVIAGSGTFSLNTNPNATVSGMAVGINRYVWTITTSCGTSKDTVQITRNASPTTSNAGTDQNICGTSATLAGNSPATGTGTWTVISGTGTFANANLFNSGVTGLSNGANVFEWTISNGICPSSSDQVQITSNPVPVVVTNNDTTVCPGNSVTLNATGASSYTWSPSTNLNTTTGPTVISTPTATRTYTVTGTQGICSAQDVVVVTLGTTTAPTISINASGTTICAGQTVNFTSTVTNQGTAPTYQWKINGINIGTNSSTFSSNTLVNGDVITCQMISNKPCVSPTTVTSNSINITVNPSVTPNINISATGPVNICAAQNITFTSSITAGGSTPVYQWQVNGANVGTNSSSYSSTSWNNGDVVRCILTSNANCATTTLDTSNFITVTVSTPVTASVSISSSGTSICSGQNVTFFAAPVNGGGTPSFQWQVNGVNAGTNSPVFNTTTLTNGNVVTCQLFSSAGCASPSPATSNAIFMTVTNSVTPTVSINASSTNICAGTNVIFNAAISGGGSTPFYQWQVNGNNVGTNSSSYSSTGLNNGDVITCTLTSNATCATPSSVVSNTVTMTVSTGVTPGITISAINNPTCMGGTIAFSSSVTNGGPTPIYDWKVNGVSVGVSTSSFNTSTLNNGDVVTCILTSSVACAFPTQATSNTITAVIQPAIVPSISISTLQNPICSGQNVSFSATISNGGASPVYQWKVNGTNVGTNSPSFVSSSLNNGDVVTCQLTSNATCASPATIVSNSVVMTVNNYVTPTVSISANDTTICTGETVIFNAGISNGGPSPVFQWKVNGVNAGTNSSTFSTAALNNGDVVTCELTSNTTCPNPVTAISNSISVDVGSGITPSITISVDNNPVCNGTTMIYSSVIANGGISPTYTWMVNGSPIGASTPGFSSALLQDGDIVTCILNSSDACAFPNNISSNPITVSINSITPSISISASDTTICPGQTVIFTSTINNGGSGPLYQWQLNGGNISGETNATFSSNSLVNGDVINCVFTSNAACASPSSVTSASISMSVLVQNPGITIATTDSVICSNEATSFTATANNLGTGTVYQWQVNGVNAGTNSLFFNPSSVSNNDVITCIVSTNNGCGIGSATSGAITFTVNIVPVVQIMADDTTPCFDDDITLTGSGATSYYWMVDGSTNSVYNSTAGSTTNYILIGTDANGCSDTNNIVLNILSLPTVIANNDTSICPNNNVQLNATGGVGYVWTPSTGLNNSGIANPIATLNTSINYTVQVTGSNGCIQTEDVLITVIPCLGLEEEEVEINIYPNPFNDYITLEGITELTQVKLHNALGEVIRNWMISSSNNIIETADLKSGMYFLSFEINGKTVTKKIIKK